MALIRKTVEFHKGGTPCECFIADSAKEMAGGAYRATLKSPNAYKWDWGEDREDFLGRNFNNMKECVEAVSQPWEEGLKLMWEMIHELRGSKLPILSSKKRRTKFLDEGDDVDLDKMRSGQQYWHTAKREKVSGIGTLTILSDIRANWTLTPEQVLWRGAAAVVLTYLLEEAGYRVELWSAQAGKEIYGKSHYSWTGKGDMLAAVKVKGHRDPINVGIAASTVSAWFYRGITFHAANMAHEKIPLAHAGMDRTGGLKPFINVLSNDEHNFIVQSIWDKNSAFEYIRKSAEAIEAGEIAALPWHYSKVNAETVIVTAFKQVISHYLKDQNRTRDMWEEESE